MKLEDVKTLIDAMTASDLTKLEASRDGWTLRMERGGQSTSAPRTEQAPSRPTRSATPVPAPVAPPSDAVAAPISGIVYLAASPEAPPFAPLGSAVEAGAVICLVEAMKVFVEVRSERAGHVAQVLVASGAEVQAGQALMRIA